MRRCVLLCFRCWDIGGYKIYKHTRTRRHITYAHDEMKRKLAIVLVVVSCFMLYLWWWPLKDKAHRDEITKKPLCTFKLLREYYREHHRYPGDGQWDLSGYRNNPHYEWNIAVMDWNTTLPERNSSRPPRFILDICRLRHRIIHQDQLSRCLVNNNIRSVTSFGDSNGAMYNAAVRGLINRIRTGTCIKKDAERSLEHGFKPDKQYFTNGNQDWAKFVEIGKRKCRSCRSALFTCNVTSDQVSRDVSIEHVSQMAIIDTSIQLNASDWLASTSQEFMLKYFLAGRYPDVMILFLPFHHTVFEEDFHVALEQLRSFKALVDKHVPSRTKVFFLPAHNVWHKPGKPGKGEAIRRLNHALYVMMESDMLQPGSNRYGFLDSLVLSKSRSDWTINWSGIHMTRVWYQTIMSMFWQTLCNSASENAW